MRCLLVKSLVFTTAGHNNMRLILTIASLIALLGAARAGVTNTIPCDFLAISNAIATVAEGDTIQIQAGSCVISNTITHNRNVSFTMRGAGTNLTTLISPAIGSVFGINKNSTNLLTISDLNCIGHSANGYGFFIVGVGAPSAKMSGPVRFTRIQMTNLLYRGFSVGYSDSWGVIDHCYLVAGLSGGSAYQPFSFNGNDIVSWTNSNPLGTTNAWYVEDCYAKTGTVGGNGFFDAYDGAQIVIRNNYFDGNAPSGVHGYDSQYTSCRTWEIYNNTFTNVTPSVLAIEIRGGTGNIFSNKVYGAADFLQLAYYRSCLYAHSIVTGIGTPGVTNIIDFGGINPTNGQRINLGFNDEYYTFANPIVNTNKCVFLGSTLAESLTNLGAALQLSGVAGTTYGSSTTKNRQWMQASISATELMVYNALDGNIDGTGYPANQQPGVIQAWPYGTNAQTLLPIYVWGNTKDGTNVTTNLKDDSAVCDYNITNLVKLGRDYFNSARPGYTPLVYPHPLVSGTPWTPPESIPPAQTNTVNAIFNDGFYINNGRIGN